MHQPNGTAGTAGIEIIDGIGATEMFHIFILADKAHAQLIATGVAIRSHRARVAENALQRRAARQPRLPRGAMRPAAVTSATPAKWQFHYQSRTDNVII